MNRPKPRRKRGVILTPEGMQKLQAAQAEAESDENSGNRYTFQALSDRIGLNPDTLTKVYSGVSGVDKRTLNRCFSAFNLVLEPEDYCQLAPKLEGVEEQGRTTVKVLHDWGEAPDVSVFYGRAEELAMLKHWILDDRCRLVTVLGMGGMGKTYLSVKLAEQIQDKFDFVIWRSLRHAPPVKELLAELIQFLSNEQKTHLSETIYGRVTQLIHYLRTSRCLVVLDNAETILQKYTPQNASCDDDTDRYREGFKGYRELLRRLGETRHQSCLVLTSRKRPKEVGLLEGKTLPVRVMKLKGLQVAEAREIFKAKGTFWGPPAEWNRLVEYYAGNPLALNIVAKTIHELFDGKISEFLNHNTAVFGEICHLLDQQFEHLLDEEKKIINWLARTQQPTSFVELRERLSSSISPQKLLEALESLEERSLIEKAAPTLLEKKAAHFLVQPMVMEYFTNRFIEGKMTEDPLNVFSDEKYQRLAAQG